MSIAMGRQLIFYGDFPFQPVFYNWSNKGHGMYCPFCVIVHIKDPLLLIGTMSHITINNTLSRPLNKYFLSSLFENQLNLPYN